MFCAPELIFCGTVGVGPRFHDLRTRTRFRLYRGRRVSFSYFACSDSVSAVLRASDPIFMFCAPELIFCGNYGVESRFQWCRGRRLPFSCFTCSYSFSAVPRASGTFFMICAPELVFDGTDSVGSRFHVLLSQTCFRRYRRCPLSFSAVSWASGPILMVFTLGLVFGGTDDVHSRFRVSCAQTHFRWFRGRGVPFSCFMSPYLFSMVPRASGPVLLFCAPEQVFGGIDDVRSRFHVLRSRTRFRRYRGRQAPF
jgi:hypothetical protein